ncbi:MAG: hypothetical protein U1E73_05875 [Planctomycetota bacterium]
MVLLPLASPAVAQEKKFVVYPDRDALTPFRTPTETYAPPDRLFLLLGRMLEMAAAPGAAKATDPKGREVVDDATWRDMRNEAERIGIDAGYLGTVIRTSKNAEHRRIAFYAMFYCDRIDYVFNLISHIPGEPKRSIREEAMPRAIEYLRHHIQARFGDLGEDQRKAVVAAMPQIGSPAAKTAGITRLPRDDDHLYDGDLRLKPFFQLTELDDPMDQAQGLWFLKELFAVRKDLPELWLEPSVPRIRQLLASDSRIVREQVIGLLTVVGGKDLPPANADDDPTTLRDWAELALRNLFPPIRNFHGSIISMYPSPERDAIATAAVKALENSSIGEARNGKTKAGNYYRGFLLLTVPAELEVLALPRGAVITAVNGTNVSDGQSLLRTVKQQLDALAHPRVLMVEFVQDDEPHAIEYRIM